MRFARIDGYAASPVVARIPRAYAMGWPVTAPTYATLADVVRAKLAGTLPADLRVVVDNDSVCALSGADDYHGLSDDGPAAALVAVLDVLGIKAVRP